MKPNIVAHRPPIYLKALMPKVTQQQRPPHHRATTLRCQPYNKSQMHWPPRFSSSAAITYLSASLTTSDISFALDDILLFLFKIYSFIPLILDLYNIYIFYDWSEVYACCVLLWIFQRNKRLSLCIELMFMFNIELVFMWLCSKRERW